MTTQWFRVSAGHTHSDHACTNRLAQVDESDYGEGAKFYAVVQGYGCSKNYPTPEDAIRGMLYEHACTGIKIVPILGVAEVEAARSEWWA